MMIFNNEIAILRVQFVALASCKYPVHFSFYARVDSIGFLFLPTSVEIISCSYTKSIS